MMNTGKVNSWKKKFMLNGKNANVLIKWTKFTVIIISNGSYHHPQSTYERFHFFGALYVHSMEEKRRSIITRSLSVTDAYSYIRMMENSTQMKDYFFNSFAVVTVARGLDEWFGWFGLIFENFLRLEWRILNLCLTLFAFSIHTRLFKGWNCVACVTMRLTDGRS